MKINVGNVHIVGGSVGQVITGDLVMREQTMTFEDGRMVIQQTGVQVGGSGTATGSGSVATEQRQLVGTPTRLYCNIGTVDVTVGVALSCEVSVSADDNLLPQLVTEVDGGTLRIAFTGSVVLTSPVVVHVAIPALSMVRVTGSSHVHVADIRRSGFDCRVSGAGSLTLSGTVDKLRAELSGAGAIDAGKLHSKHAEIEVSGAGNVTAYASEKVDIEISGVGTARILGNPAARHVEKSGFGNVEWPAA